MKDRHIIEVLDGKTVAELSAEEQTAVAAHAEACPACDRAWQAARVSSLLLDLQAARRAEIEPSAFFQAKVMNAVRVRQQNLQKPIAAFRRWWQASFAPVCLMVLTVAGLIALSLFAPAGSADEETQAVVPNNLYTTDAVIMNQSNRREMTNEQVFRVIYNPRYEPNRK